MSQGINAKQSAADRREIRVFISSTFRDMHEEREELVKQIFPQLRRLCESRGVTWGEVDLRWGVPDEAKAEGKVLPLCLQEIEHCRPYFIGLLGERYGWVPEEIPESLFESQPWLRDHLHQSVTALEIFHGVLRNPDMEKHAFFYFRDSAYAAAHPDFTEEDSLRRDKLTKLKDDIRKSGFPVSEPFNSPKQLGEWVLRDLTAIIEQLYPETSIPNALDRDALDHEAYSASRRTVYIGRREYMDRLNAHAAGDGPPLVIAGESGGGKSALLANWTHDWSQQHPETPVLVHFIGATPDSANWMAMLRRLLGEFQRKFGIQIEIPDQPDALRMAFANALHMVAARGRLVLALDALNQIEDRDGAPDLVWLPPVIPASVRLVVSTLPGRPWEDLKKRGWPVMTVEPLTVPEREELIVKYLKRYSKELSPGPAHRIAAAPQTGNGLYLSTLLNELRQFGRYEELDQRIDWYLQAANPIELYRKVIERWEQDYGQPDPACVNLVLESMTRLWAARRGLSESELIGSLGMPGPPLARAYWSPLYLAAGDALVNRGGLLTFAHDFLREAVRSTYIPTASHQNLAHGKLAAYFVTQTPGPRMLDELPWLMQEATDWLPLSWLLAEPSFLLALWKKDKFDASAYWAAIELNSQIRMEETYASVIHDPSRDPVLAECVSNLLNYSGKREQSLQIRAGLAERYRKNGDQTKLHQTLLLQAVSLIQSGELNAAMALLDEKERICTSIGDESGLANCWGERALILRQQGDLDGAMVLRRKEERVYRELGNKSGLATSLGNQAIILQDRNDFEGAMKLYEEMERISREIEDKQGIQVSLGEQGNILFSRRDFEGAMKLYKEKERICRELGNKEGLSFSLGYQANILTLHGDAEGALALLKKEECHSRELGDPEGLAMALGNQAMTMCRILGRMDDAYRLVDEAIAIAIDQHSERLILKFQRLRTRIPVIAALKLNGESGGNIQSGAAAYVKNDTTNIRQTWATPSPPHPSADGARAAQLNLEYQKARRAWEALPWLKRMRTPRPEPPTGI